MPRVLNVERLENKFACLTRARESVTALSLWIMHHSEFCEEIVEEWLAGLSKNFHALAMCYVANDVIMNCGKKRVPQFRAAFSKVLEKAMCLKNVKEISKEVCRMLQIWQERDIFNESFCDTLKSKLNDPPIEESTTDTDLDETKVDEEEEERENETDIISNFKKENLFDKLIKLKYLNDEVIEKEEILKFADEPQRPDFQTAGQRECQNLLRKVDTYCATLKGFIKLADEEVSTRKKVLKELKNTNIFYVSQNEDVKKVAHAYKIYGRKINIVSKALSEKKETMEDKSVSYTSDNDMSSPKSPDETYVSPVDSSNCDSMPTTPHSPSYLHSNSGKISPETSFSHSLSSTLSEKLKSPEEQEIKLEKEEKPNISLTTEELQNIILKTSKSMTFSPSLKSPKTIDTPILSSSDSVNNLKQKETIDMTSPVKSMSVSPVHQSPKIVDNQNSSSIDGVSTKSTNTMKKKEIIHMTSPVKPMIFSPAHQSPKTADKVLLSEDIHKKSTNTSMKNVIIDIDSDKLTNILASVSKISSECFNTPIQETSSFMNVLAKDSISDFKSLTKDVLKVSEEDNFISNSENLISTVKENDIVASDLIKNAVEINSTKPESALEKIEPVADVPEKDDKTLKRESFKRKIELLLKTKGKKHCPIPDQQHDSELKQQESRDLNIFRSLSSELIKPSSHEELSVINVKETVDDNQISKKLKTSPKIFTISAEPEKMESEDISSTIKESDENGLNENSKNEIKISESDIMATDNINDIQNPNIHTDILMEENNFELQNEDQNSLQKVDDFNSFPIPQDTFFSSVCSSASFEKVKGIPGLEILDPVKAISSKISLVTEKDKEMSNIDATSTDQSSKPTADENVSELLPPNDNEEVHCMVTEEDSSSHLSNCENNSEDTSNTCDISENITSNDLKIECSKESSGSSLEDQNKPKNLLNSLQSLLKCLSQSKALNFGQNISDNITEKTPKPLPYMPLEDCLRIYGALKYKPPDPKNTETNDIDNRISEDTVMKTNINDNTHINDSKSCTTTNVLHGSIVSAFDSSLTLCPVSNEKKQSFPVLATMEEDNREVADMECDSD